MRNQFRIWIPAITVMPQTREEKQGNKPSMAHTIIRSMVKAPPIISRRTQTLKWQFTTIHQRDRAKTRNAINRISQPQPPPPLGSQIRYMMVAIRTSRPIKTHAQAMQQAQSPPQIVQVGQGEGGGPGGVRLGVTLLLGVAVGV